MIRPKSLAEVTREWLNSIPKVVNQNGCWIPNKKAANNGYVQIWIGCKYLLLHRLVLMVYHNIDYYNRRIVTRHGPKCDKSCFNYDHLIPGTNSENEYDKVRNGGHHHSNKTSCPSCNSEYKIRIIKTGPNKGTIRRWCPVCNHKDRQK